MAEILHIPEPELEITLIDGGTFDANTTYYVTAIWRGNYRGISRAYGEYSFTTTTTQKAINIKAKYWDGGQYVYTTPNFSGLLGDLNSYMYLWVVFRTTPFKSGADWIMNSTDELYINSLSRYYTQFDLDIDFDITAFPVNYSSRSYYFLPQFWLSPYKSNPLPSGFSMDAGVPIIFSETATDNFNDLCDAMDNDPNFVNYIIPRERTSHRRDYLVALADLYINNWDEPLDNVQMTFILGRVFISKGNRLTIQRNFYSMGGSITIQEGDSNYAKDGSYRGSTFLTGANNQHTAYGSQFQIGYDDKRELILVNDYILTNGLDGSDNKTFYNGYINWQIVARETRMKNWKFYLSDMLVSYDIRVYSGNEGWAENNAFEIVWEDWYLETTRESEGEVDYIADRKPKLGWPWIGAVEEYIQKYHVWENHVNLTIEDNNGNIIEGATVTISNGFGISQDVTDENGYVSILHRVREAHKYGLVSETGEYQTDWVDEVDVTITITKNGYNTYIEQIKLFTLLEKTIALQPPIYSEVPPTVEVQSQEPTIIAIIEEETQ